MHRLRLKAGRKPDGETVRAAALWVRHYGHSKSPLLKRRQRKLWQRIYREVFADFGRLDKLYAAASDEPPTPERQSLLEPGVDGDHDGPERESVEGRALSGIDAATAMGSHCDHEHRVFHDFVFRRHNRVVGSNVNCHGRIVGATREPNRRAWAVEGGH